MYARPVEFTRYWSPECFSFSSASVYFHLFHPHNHHLSPNSPRLMFLFVKCATVNKVYLISSILTYLIGGSPHKGQQRQVLMLSFMCAWTNGWTHSRYAGDLRRHGAHCDVTIMMAYLLDSWPIATQSSLRAKLRFDRAIILHTRTKHFPEMWVIGH